MRTWILIGLVCVAGCASEPVACEGEVEVEGCACATEGELLCDARPRRLRCTGGVWQGVADACGERDAGMRDASVPDASGEDSGIGDGGGDAGELDAAPAPIDGGPPPLDARPPAIDGGPPPLDAGPPAIDAGTDAGVRSEMRYCVDIFVSNTCEMSVVPSEITIPRDQIAYFCWRNRSEDYPLDVWLSYGGGYTDLAPGATWNEPPGHCLGPLAHDEYADISTACSEHRFLIHCL